MAMARIGALPRCLVKTSKFDASRANRVTVACKSDGFATRMTVAQKKGAAGGAAPRYNREASNRVDRSHSENPDDWITHG